MSISSVHFKFQFQVLISNFNFKFKIRFSISSFNYMFQFHVSVSCFSFIFQFQVSIQISFMFKFLLKLKFLGFVEAPVCVYFFSCLLKACVWLNCLTTFYNTTNCLIHLQEVMSVVTLCTPIPLSRQQQKHKYT